MEEGYLNNPRAAKFVVVCCQSTLGASVKAALQREATLQRNAGPWKFGARPISRSAPQHPAPHKSSPYNAVPYKSAPQHAAPLLDSGPEQAVPPNGAAENNAAPQHSDPPVALLQVVSSEAPLESVQQLDPDLVVLDIAEPDAPGLADLLKNRGRTCLLLLCATERLAPRDSELASLLSGASNVSGSGVVRILGPEVSVADVLAHCQQMLYGGSPSRLPGENRPSLSGGRAPLDSRLPPLEGRPPFDSRVPFDSRSPSEGRVQAESRAQQDDRALFDSKAPLDSRAHSEGKVPSDSRSSQRRNAVGYAPRPSEPPRPAHSVPAPLLPSSHPPSSHPSGRASAGSSPPGFVADVLQETLQETAPKLQGEFGSELNTLLREAEQRALARHVAVGGAASVPHEPATGADASANLLDSRLRAELNWALSLGVEGAVRPTAPDSNYTSASLSEATALNRNLGSQLPTIAGDDEGTSGISPGTDTGEGTGSGSLTSEIPGKSDSGADAEDSTNASTARPPAPRRATATDDSERIPTVPPAPGLPRGQWLERSLPERPPEPRPTSPPRQRGRLSRLRNTRSSGHPEARASHYERPPESGPNEPESVDSPPPDAVLPADAHAQRVVSSLDARRNGAPANGKVRAPKSQPEAKTTGPRSGSALAPGVAVQRLAEAIRTRFTGVLSFEHSETVRRVVFHDGDFVTTASGLASESLTAYLAETGVLARSVERHLSHRLPNFGRHAGAALVAGGYLQQQQLWAALRAHAEELISRVVRLNAGTVHTETSIPERLRTEPSVFGGTTGAEVLLELLRRSFEPEQAKERLGGSDVRLELNPSSTLLDECALSEAARADLHVALSYPLGTALRRTQDAEFACVLYALTELQCIKVTARGSRRPARQDKTRSLASAEGDIIALRQAVEVRRALVQEADYFALLGVQRGATGYAIRSAYLQLKREFDPLRIQQDLALADLQADVYLIQEVLDEAYGILSDSGRRERYLSAIESTSTSQLA